jgi:uncharacterized membrane protein
MRVDLISPLFSSKPYRTIILYGAGCAPIMRQVVGILTEVTSVTLWRIASLITGLVVELAGISAALAAVESLREDMGHVRMCLLRHRLCGWHS